MTTLKERQAEREMTIIDWDAHFRDQKRMIRRAEHAAFTLGFFLGVLLTLIGILIFWI